MPGGHARVTNSTARTTALHAQITHCSPNTGLESNHHCANRDPISPGGDGLQPAATPCVSVLSDYSLHPSSVERSNHHAKQFVHSNLFGAGCIGCIERSLSWSNRVPAGPNSYAERMGTPSKTCAKRCTPASRLGVLALTRAPLMMADSPKSASIAVHVCSS